MAAVPHALYGEGEHQLAAEEERQYHRPPPRQGLVPHSSGNRSPPAEPVHLAVGGLYSAQHMHARSQPPATTAIPGAYQAYSEPVPPYTHTHVTHGPPQQRQGYPTFSYAPSRDMPPGPTHPYHRTSSSRRTVVMRGEPASTFVSSPYTQEEARAPPPKRARFSRPANVVSPSQSSDRTHRNSHNAAQARESLRRTRGDSESSERDDWQLSPQQSHQVPTSPHHYQGHHFAPDLGDDLPPPPSAVDATTDLPPPRPPSEPQYVSVLPVGTTVGYPHGVPAAPHMYPYSAVWRPDAPYRGMSAGQFAALPRLRPSSGHEASEKAPAPIVLPDFAPAFVPTINPATGTYVMSPMMLHRDNVEDFCRGRGQFAAAPGKVIRGTPDGQLQIPPFGPADGAASFQRYRQQHMPAAPAPEYSFGHTLPRPPMYQPAAPLHAYGVPAGAMHAAAYYPPRQVQLQPPQVSDSDSDGEGDGPAAMHPPYAYGSRKPSYDAAADGSSEHPQSESKWSPSDEIPPNGCVRGSPSNNQLLDTLSKRRRRRLSRLVDAFRDAMLARDRSAREKSITALVRFWNDSEEHRATIRRRVSRNPTQMKPIVDKLGIPELKKVCYSKLKFSQRPRHRKSQSHNQASPASATGRPSTASSRSSRPDDKASADAARQPRDDHRAANERAKSAERHESPTVQVSPPSNSSIPPTTRLSDSDSDGGRTSPSSPDVNGEATSNDLDEKSAALNADRVATGNDSEMGGEKQGNIVDFDHSCKTRGPKEESEDVPKKQDAALSQDHNNEPQDAVVVPTSKQEDNTDAGIAS